MRLLRFYVFYHTIFFMLGNTPCKILASPTFKQWETLVAMQQIT